MPISLLSPFKELTQKAKPLWESVTSFFKPKPKFLNPLAQKPTPTPDFYAQKGYEKTGPGQYRRKEPISLSPSTPKIESVPTAKPVTPTLSPTPVAKLTPIPSHIKELEYGKRPYHGEISGAWGDRAGFAHDILRYVNKEGVVKGENTSYMAGDTKNTIDPKTGKWSADAPVMVFTNPFTNTEEESIDRGLFRINNKTFYDYQRRFPGLLEKAGIFSWDDMLDPAKNSAMAKIIFDIQKRGWYAAPPGSEARL